MNTCWKLLIKNCQERIKELEQLKQPGPSLNNYLVAAILSGEVVYQSHKHLAEAVRKRVLALSGDEVLVAKPGQTHKWGMRSMGETGNVLLAPEDIFLLPKAHLDAKTQAANHNVKINEAIDKIKQYQVRLQLKIQIGSDKALEDIIEQADGLTSLSLTENLIADMPRISQTPAELLLLQRQQQQNSGEITF